MLNEKRDIIRAVVICKNAAVLNSTMDRFLNTSSVITRISCQKYAGARPKNDYDSFGDKMRRFGDVFRVFAS